MCDGEEAQIRILQEEEMQRLFDETLIGVGKTPASCSAITQSSEVSMLFKAAEQVLKDITRNDYRNALLERILKTVFIQLRMQYRDSDFMSSPKECRFIDTLQRIVYTIYKTINPDIIINGYRNCGQDAPISLNAASLTDSLQWENMKKL